MQGIDFFSPLPEGMERVSDCKMVYRETYAIGDENKGNIIDKRYYKKQES